METKQLQNGWNQDGSFDASNISRCDKIDFLFKMPEDLFQQYKQSLVDLCTEVVARYDVLANWHVHSMGFTPDKSKRIYIFETWGHFSNALLQELPASWYKFICRLDYNMTVDLDENQLIPIEYTFKKNNKKKRNITTYDSAVRQKKEQRDAGGKGLALGSKGADKRVTLYKRGQERGTIEFQFRGKALQAILENVRKLALATDEYDRAELTMICLQSAAHDLSLEAGTGTLDELVAMATNVYEVESTGKSIAYAINELAQYLETLDDSVRMNVFNQLGFTSNDLIRIATNGQQYLFN